MDKFKKAMLGYIERHKDEIMERHCEIMVGYPAFGINILGDRVIDEKTGFDFGSYDYSEGTCATRYLDIKDKFANYDKENKILYIDFNKSKKEIKRIVNDYIDAVYDAYQKQFKGLECGKPKSIN